VGRRSPNGANPQRRRLRSRPCPFEGSARSFQQTFNLADHVKVTSAAIENGLLTIELMREVPEELKPRRIEIATDERPTLSQDNAKRVEHEPSRAA
jgi:molecular chaperone IbpA